MTTPINSALIESYKHTLENHPVYAAVRSEADLRCFMEHHVYSVWDFMSLIKYLQSVIAPSRYPWSHRGDASVRRFINELVLEEESDEGLEAGTFTSHFHLYQAAMQEIGADVVPSNQFVEAVQSEGIDAALQTIEIPVPAKRFTGKTFEFIHNGKAHQVAAALALGREHIIPTMFRAILAKIGVADDRAPVFHYYLNRHVHLDEDFHAPLSLRLLDQLCAGEEAKIQEAMVAADEAIHARLQFWDGVREAIESRRG
jgi:hypothetical protein